MSEIVYAKMDHDKKWFMNPLVCVKEFEYVVIWVVL